MRQVGYVLLVVSAVALVAQLWYFAPQLPLTVASHFGPNGVADAQVPRSQFLATQIVLQVAMPAFLILVGKLSRHIPDSLINVPHKEYWLHPDRRVATLKYNENLLLFIAGMTSALLIVVFQLTYDANLQRPPQLRLGVFVPVVAVYIAAVCGVSLHAVRKFSRRDSAEV